MYVLATVPRLTIPRFSGRNCSYVSEATSVEICPILHVLAIKILDNCLTCFRNRPKATLVDTSILLSLGELASEQGRNFNKIFGGYQTLPCEHFCL